MRGTSWTSEFIGGLCEEVRLKSNIGFNFEQKEDEFRVFIGQPRGEKIEIRHGPLNPILQADFKKVAFAELEKFRETLYDWILKADLPADGLELVVWRIHDRTTLFKCFPAWERDGWETSTLVDFLGTITLDHGILWGYFFEDPEPWTYVCRPKDGLTWEDVRALILKARSLPPLAERYGISTDAAALVKWFSTLGPSEWLGISRPRLKII